MKMAERKPCAIEDVLSEEGIDSSLIILVYILAEIAKLCQELPQQATEKLPKKKKEEFRWQESLLEAAKLLGGRQPEEMPEHQELTKWPRKVEQELVSERPLHPLDFSFAGLEVFDVTVDPRMSKEQPIKDEKGLFVTNCVRLRHNQISSLAGLNSFIKARVAHPSNIECLDLSYNKIFELDSKMLSVMPRLKSLYLHCNCLDDLDEVRKLRFVRSLRTLTLFGNPIEATQDYRLIIATALPMLKKIDWGVVTPRERLIAKKYIKMMKEREMMESEELKLQKAAAEEEKEKELKREEKKKKEQEQEAIDTDDESKSESKIDVTQGTEASDNNEMQKEGFEKITNELERTISENLETPTNSDERSEELFEVILPADLADPGPLDVKGKHKLNPDFLTSEIEGDSTSSSTESLFSTDTVTLEEIKQKFDLLKEMEAVLDQEYY